MHLTEEEIEKLLANRLQHADQERVVRHLLTGCGLCSRLVVEQSPDLLLEKAAEDRHRKIGPSSTRERALTAAVEQEARWRTDERKLERSLELLRTTPGGYDALTFRQAESLRGAPLVEALIHQSFELRFRSPKTMRWLAYNAVQAAECLRPEEHGRLLVFDLRGRARQRLQSQ